VQHIRLSYPPWYCTADFVGRRSESLEVLPFDMYLKLPQSRSARPSHSLSRGTTVRRDSSQWEDTVPEEVESMIPKFLLAAVRNGVHSSARQQHTRAVLASFLSG
jgi:hypothetical protein